VNHRLAKELGMTVGEALSRMSAREYLNWMLYWQYEAGERQTKEQALQEIAKWRQ
jgi:hypothetical protein